MGKVFKIIRTVGIVLFLLFGVALLVLSLPFTGWKGLSVQTGSMVPSIPPGALVFVHSVPAASLQTGDVITYKSKTEKDQTITHRIVEVKGEENGPKQFILKGDANNANDAPVYENQIVGKVEHSVPMAGHFVDLLHTPAGLTAMVYLPVVLVGIYEIKLLVRRLTKLEIVQQKASEQTTEPPLQTRRQTLRVAPAPAKPLQVVHTPEKPITQQPKPRPRQMKKRSIDGIS